MSHDLILALSLAMLAGLAIPIGAALAVWRQNLLPLWTVTEARHAIIAFGAGALLAAIALVLIPEGTSRLAPFPALAWFGGGAVVFALIDRGLNARGGQRAQFLAMMMDFLPEAMALGALISVSIETAMLTAGLITLQNLPEGFNAMRELRSGGHTPSRRLLVLFALMAPLGPLAAYLGLEVLGDSPAVIGAVMLTASGGILYLMFQDIAPQVRLEAHWLAPFGAVLGFGLGLAGDLLI